MSVYNLKHKGRTYKVRYRSPNQSYDRKMVGVFKGLVAGAVNAVYAFDIGVPNKPKIVPMRWIKTVEELPDNHWETLCYDTRWRNV